MKKSIESNDKKLE